MREVPWKITASRLGAMNFSLNEEFILNSNLHKKKKGKVGSSIREKFLLGLLNVALYLPFIAGSRILLMKSRPERTKATKKKLHLSIQIQLKCKFGWLFQLQLHWWS
jgi:hypothetical protein